MSCTKPQKLVLHIDDDPDDRFLVNKAISAVDSTLVLQQASNGVKAIDILIQAKEQGNLPCLIILDMNMPLLNGYETYKRIRKDPALANIPIVIFTTAFNEQEMERWKGENAILVTKPAEFSEFSACIKRILGYCSPPSEDGGNS